MSSTSVLRVRPRWWRTVAVVSVLALAIAACSSPTESGTLEYREDTIADQTYSIDGVGSVTCGIDATLSIDCGFTLDDGVETIPIGTVRQALETVAGQFGYTIDLTGIGIVIQAWGGKGNQTGAYASSNSTGQGGAAQTFKSFGDASFADGDNLYVYIGDDGSAGGGGAATVVSTEKLTSDMFGVALDNSILLVAGGSGGAGQTTDGGSIVGNQGASGWSPSRPPLRRRRRAAAETVTRPPKTNAARATRTAA